ncbi:hypothetical protein JTE90_023018 [Oedothorax gibbosus]|uniref:Uncharacterized protein n=1 Tax=Oedothorax gibbosus TaxID=931172 RepID=A0AAV6V2H2_9ARAC|nr:hypothetical protein JTE90_023018 [Oedothorax gibbosus]
MGDAVDGPESETMMGDDANSDREMFMDASKEFILNLYLTESEIATYEARRKACWEAEDPIKCKDELDQEYRKVIFNRVNELRAPNLNMDMYKALLSSLVFVIKKFSGHAGLTDIQTKTDYDNNVTWIRVPEIIECNLQNRPPPARPIIKPPKVKSEEKASRDEPQVLPSADQPELDNVFGSQLGPFPTGEIFIDDPMD